MKKIENKKGFLIAEISLDEAYKLGWGNVCDDCNETLTGDRFFIPVLGRRCYCKKCFDEWMETAIRYDEDILYEETEWNRFLDTCIYCGILMDKEDRDAMDMIGMNSGLYITGGLLGDDYHGTRNKLKSKRVTQSDDKCYENKIKKRRKKNKNKKTHRRK